MSDRIRVFISSTFSDLAEYREAVIGILTRYDFQTVLLEDFGAIDNPPLEATYRAIQSCELVIILIAYRFGYVPPDTDKSLTEVDYDAARLLGKLTFCFLLDERQPWPPNQVDANLTKVKAFRDRISKEGPVAYFTTPEDLAAKVAIAISQYSRQVEGISVAPSSAEKPEAPATIADVLSELRNMRAEFSVLQQAVTDLARPSTSISAEVRSANWPEFLGAPASSVNHQRCFVMMPYSEKWSVAVERIILQICTEVGLDFQIAKNMKGRFIPNDIWRGITGAGVIVADLSGKNPNVTYEMGLADVLGKYVVLIAQDDKVPFDFLGQRLIVYEDSLPGSLKLREELTDVLRRYKDKQVTG